MELTLADGRVVAWAEYGDASGRPVIFLHGTPGSRLARPPDEALAGIRLFTLDRPGYGRSTPMRRPTLLGTADAVGALMTSLGVDRFGVIGFSGGAPYAIACGARIPQRLTGVVAAGFTGPDRELHKLKGRDWLMATTMRAVPAIGRRIVTRAAGWYAIDPLQRYRKLMESGQDTWMQPYEESNLEGARQGAIGLVGDWLATDLYRWGFRLRDVTCPVLVWAGRQDPGRAVPDAPLVAERLPDATVSIAQDAAHTPSPAHWREMMVWVTVDRRDRLDN